MPLDIYFDAINVDPNWKETIEQKCTSIMKNNIWKLYDLPQCILTTK
uniref:Uncharacterized protein n=2 Tax=Physcomitrium patens TaxID=3218 RepID=A0A2K1J4J3_PHYPA|nr:hypothetical protein PHYPA_022293 [Physcomitrium patens]